MSDKTDKSTGAVEIRYPSTSETLGTLVNRAMSQDYKMVCIPSQVSPIPKPISFTDDKIIVTIDGVTDVIILSPEVFELESKDLLHFILGEANNLITRRTKWTADLVSSRVVCKKLGIEPKTLRIWANAGKIHSVRTAGNHRRYRMSEVHKLMQRENNVTI